MAGGPRPEGRSRRHVGFWIATPPPRPARRCRGRSGPAGLPGRAGSATGAASSVIRSDLPAGLTDCTSPRRRRCVYCKSSQTWAAWPGLRPVGSSGGMSVCSVAWASRLSVQFSSTSRLTEGEAWSTSSVSRQTPGREIDAPQHGQALGDLVARAEQQQRAAHRDHVAVAEDPELDRLAVDLGAVGALQVGQHELLVVLLDLQVEAADALVVELDGVALLAADGDRRGQVLERASPIGPVQNL